MGLAERRAQQIYETNVFPKQVQRVAEAAGFEVPIEADREPLMEPNHDHIDEQRWTKLYVDSLVEGFKAIHVQRRRPEGPHPRHRDDAGRGVVASRCAAARP
ncbi:hypothetical protein [Myxococcus sp. Y35]|uniref:hypothetical protein n=1 Tax=Pseudomyxococcus flavus TaxID=3115648 RepID=UPI003CEC5A23